MGRRSLGSPADTPARLQRPDAPRPLPGLRRRSVSDHRYTAVRRVGRGGVRRAVPVDCRRCHARYGPLHNRSWVRRARHRLRRDVEHDAGRARRRPFRRRRCLPEPSGGRADRDAARLDPDAGNEGHRGELTDPPLPRPDRRARPSLAALRRRAAGHAVTGRRGISRTVNRGL